MTPTVEKATIHRSRAVITGATGYIGSKLVAAMFSAGWDVHVYARSSSNLKSLGALQHQVTCHVIKVDAESLIVTTRTIKPDIIIHLASLFAVEHDSGLIEAMIDSNIKYGTLLLEAAVVTGVSHFINTGTVWEYWREDDPTPVCLYAASKRALDQIAEFYQSTYEIKVVTLALYDTYGPGDPRRKIVNLLLHLLDSGETLKMSPGEQLLDFVHVDDVTAAYLRLATLLLDEKGRSSLQGRYDVRTDKLTTLKELVELIERVSGVNLGVEWGGFDYRKRELMKPYVRNERVPGWEAKIDLESGIMNLIESRFS